MSSLSSSWSSCKLLPGQLTEQKRQFLKVKSDLLLALGAYDPDYLVLLHLSAAFDTIDHSMLLKRLNMDFAFSERALAWLTSCLPRRTQCVSVYGVSSEEVLLEVGVPQRSVLRLLLFTLNTTKLRDIAPSCMRFSLLQTPQVRRQL